MTSISPDEFPSNSDKSKADPKQQPEPRVKRIVKGTAIKRRKTSTKSFLSSFFGEEVGQVGTYIIQEVLIPAAKNTIQDMITNGIEMLLYGESGGSRRQSRRGYNRSVVSYDAYYKGDNRKPARSVESRRPARRGGSYVVEDIIIFDKGEANDVLAALEQTLNEYDSVTVADLYELAGFDGGDWTATKWGWTDLRRAGIEKVREGYLLDLPDPRPLD
jgi:hypothetical protein